ncbi:MAG: TerB family tellurite resistance protein [Kovacikia sp.]
MTIPSPPRISPKEMNLLRAVCSLAWSDGELSSEELELMLSEFSNLFAKGEEDKQHLRDELREYASQNIPLEELVPKIEREEDRELVLKLGYMVIRASRRDPNEPLINLDEKAAYRRLMNLLALPEETATRIEHLVEEEFHQEDDVMHEIAIGLGKFLGR